MRLSSCGGELEPLEQGEYPLVERVRTLGIGWVSSCRGELEPWEQGERSRFYQFRIWGNASQCSPDNFGTLGTMLSWM